MNANDYDAGDPDVAAVVGIAVVGFGGVAWPVEICLCGMRMAVPVSEGVVREVAAIEVASVEGRGEHLAVHDRDHDDQNEWMALKPNPSLSCADAEKMKEEPWPPACWVQVRAI